MENGIMELTYNLPFWVDISNFNDILVTVQKHTTVTLVVHSQRAILELDKKSDEEEEEAASGQNEE